MNCCPNCFSSAYLQSFFSDSEKGDCNFCGYKNTPVREAKELSVQLASLLNYYDVDNVHGLSIETQIQKDFPNQILKEGNKNQKNLLQAIVGNHLEQYGKIFNNNAILSLKQGDRHELQIQDHFNAWEEFKKELKFENRFHIKKAINLQLLELFFKQTLSTIIRKNEIFYRGRISEMSGFDLTEMGNPPKEKATAGRANPYGISYLYLASDVETALYETRSSIFDFVTIGEFIANENLSVVNLREITAEPIRWAEIEELDKYLTYTPFLLNLQRELSKPIKKTDKEIDYLPTQYLSEYVKSLGYDGMKFQSSFYPKGYNLTIFSTQKLSCIDRKVYEITNTKYHYSLLMTVRKSYVH